MKLPEFVRDLGFHVESRLSSQWTTVNGWRMHSRSSLTNNGDNTLPFVFIHGLVISSLYMIPLAEWLAANRSAIVHALDLPGFGRSEAPSEVLNLSELAESSIAWMNARGVERCHLVANSLGCEIAAHVAVKAPEKVATMTLVGPTLDPESMPIPTQTLRLLQDAAHEPIRLWLNWFFDFYRAGVRLAIGTTRAMFSDPIQGQLPRIEAPTLIIRGGKDPTVPQHAAEQMLQLLRHGRLLVFDGEPHCVHYTQPGLIGAAIFEHSAMGGRGEHSGGTT